MPASAPSMFGAGADALLQRFDRQALEVGQVAPHVLDVALLFQAATHLVLGHALECGVLLLPLLIKLEESLERRLFAWCLFELVIDEGVQRIDL